MKAKTLLSDVLREAAQAYSGTRYALAKAAGVSWPSLARFLAGERDLRLKSAEALADALGLELRPRKEKREKTD